MNVSRIRLRGPQGFSLIELAVTVAIMAVLVAVAIATFHNARLGAQNRSAQQAARTAIATIKSAASTHSNFAWFPGADDAELAAALQTIEPSLTFVATPSTGPSVVSTSREDDDTVVIATRSESGDCWYVRVELNERTYFGKNVDGGFCDANSGTLVVANINSDEFSQ